MSKIKQYTGYLRERFLIDASTAEEEKIIDFIDAHKLPQSFYIELRLREMDKRLIQTKNLEETLKNMTEKRNLIVECNLTLHLKAIMKALQIFTKSSGAVCYVVDPISKTHLHVILYFEGQSYIKPIGEAFKISDRFCLATSAAANKEIMMTSYIRKDSRFPLENGWPQSDKTIGLAVPILTKNYQVLAILELTKNMYSHEYSPIDVEAVSLLTSLLSFLFEESEITTETEMLLTFINPMMKLITRYLEYTLPVATIISQLTFMNKNELGAINSSFCIKKTIRKLQYNVTYTEDPNNTHCHVETSKTSSSNDKSYLGRSMRTARTIKGRDKDGQHWFCGIPIKFNEVTGALQFQFPCMQEPKISEKNEKLLEITCTFLAFILEMNDLREELFKHEKEIIVIEDMLKLQTCHCNHELHELEEAPDTYESYHKNQRRYTWAPDISNSSETNVTLFRNFVGERIGHLFYNRKSLNEFILFIKRTHTHDKEINFRHVMVTTHFITTFLERNGEFFSPVEKDALVMSAICHVLHKCHPVYFYIYDLIFQTFKIGGEGFPKLAFNRIINKMKRWKYFYPCNSCPENNRFGKKYREIINLIKKKKFSHRKKCHRELIILAIIINADKCVYYKDKVFMTHHDEYCIDWNIEFSLHKKETKYPVHLNEIWTPKLLNQSDIDEYQSKKRLAIDLICSLLQPWFNILKILFEDTEYLQDNLDQNLQILMKTEEEILNERRKTFMFRLKPTGLWLNAKSEGDLSQVSR